MIQEGFDHVVKPKPNGAEERSCKRRIEVFVSCFIVERLLVRSLAYGRLENGNAQDEPSPRATEEAKERTVPLR